MYAPPVDDLLRFRAPGHAPALRDLLARAWPGATHAAREAALQADRVRVDGRSVRDGRRKLAPGERIEVSGVRPGSALDDRAPALGARVLALVPRLPWRSGELGSGEGALAFRVLEERGPVAALELRPKDVDAMRLRARLASAGAPVLGDVRHGGVLVGGGLRLATLEETERVPEDAWPLEAIFAPDANDDPEAALRVSVATLRALARGHPHVIADTETGDVGRFAPGAVVGLRAPDGVLAPILVRIEGTGALAARVWSHAGEPSRTARGRAGASTALRAQGGLRAADVPGVETRVARALARRAAWLPGGAEESDTSACRLIHGEADALPGLFVDRLGPCLRVIVTGRAAEPLVARAIETISRRTTPRHGEPPPVVQVTHLRGAPAGRFEQVRLVRGRLPREWLDDAGRLEVRERGLRFAVDLGLGEPERARPGVGLFLDQRDNRERTSRRARGGRFLNLFAHTGAFSVALLAAGAKSVTSVDLSPAYLRWLEENLRRNGLHDARHRAIAGDGRRHLESLDPGERFDGIVIDPPTAAAAGHRFWSVRRDLPPLVARALRQLAPGGWLLVCRNDRAARGDLADAVRRIAAEAEVPLARVEPAPPGPDFPALAGFPEGDPFEGVIARRAPSSPPARRPVRKRARSGRARGRGAR